jgi:small subunit ribosomal protein S7
LIPWGFLIDDRVDQNTEQSGLHKCQLKREEKLMSRRKIIDRRPIDPDPRFNSLLVSKFTNGLMERGKKSLAQRIFYDAMDIVETKVQDSDVLTVFEEAMEKVRPKVEVKSRRVGGATYQVPMEVRQTRRNALAIRWIIGFAKSRSGKSMSEKLAAELVDAYNNRGSAVKKRDDTHRMAEANKAFAHYRW